jgi:hypothetical protein
MSEAHKLLALEIATVPKDDKKIAQTDLLNTMMNDVRLLSIVKAVNA